MVEHFFVSWTKNTRTQLLSLKNAYHVGDAGGVIVIACVWSPRFGRLDFSRVIALDSSFRDNN